MLKTIKMYRDAYLNLCDANGSDVKNEVPTEIADNESGVIENTPNLFQDAMDAVLKFNLV